MLTQLFKKSCMKSNGTFMMLGVGKTNSYFLFMKRKIKQ